MAAPKDDLDGNLAPSLHIARERRPALNDLHRKHRSAQKIRFSLVVRSDEHSEVTDCEVSGFVDAAVLANRDSAEAH